MELLRNKIGHCSLAVKQGFNKQNKKPGTGRTACTISLPINTEQTPATLNN